jgi:hypothetical protein
VFKRIEVADGRVWLRPEGVECFAGDLSEQEQKIVYATHYAPAADLFSRNAPGTAWKSKPTWYIVAIIVRDGRIAAVYLFFDKLP